jgi:hypothetical protein
MHPMLTWLGEQLDADERIAQRIIENGKSRGGLRQWLKLEVRTEDGDTTTIQQLKVYEPEASLADITAKRAILDQHRFYLAGGQREQMCQTCGGEGVMSAVSWPCNTVRLLATAYAHRDGFDPAWAVLDEVELW